MKHPAHTKKQARALFEAGWSLADMAAETGVSTRTLAVWRDVEGWARELTPEAAVDARMTHLVLKSEKTQAEWGELKRLNGLRNQMGRRRERAEAQGEGKGGKRAEREAKAGDISGVELDKLAGPPLFVFQQEFLADEARLRFYIKGRQIGFTWTASWGALTTAIRTGRNQIFLSASKNQVGVFRDYVRSMASEYLGIELGGNKDRIALWKDGQLWATLYFLSTNVATAQSYHGDVTIDEACWIPRYEDIAKVASGMAAHKQYRRTIFSTPSAMTHPAWREFERLKKKPRPGVSTRTLTIHDAIAGGCDLFDLEQLQAEYDEQAFAQLFCCEPIDDEQSIFRLKQLERLCRDPAGWRDPGQNPVWLGYDPSRFRDAASLYVVVRTHQGQLVAYERESFANKSFRYQAERIRDYCERYNVQHVAIDVTGMGQAVFELVKAFFHRPTAINYTLEVKVGLVEQMRHLVSEGKLELPMGDQFLLRSFMAIKQIGTEGGRITYRAGRTAELGHSDTFWALAHACSFEPLKPRRRRMIIS